VEHERSADDRSRCEIGRDEGEAAPVGQRGGKAHAPSLYSRPVRRREQESFLRKDLLTRLTEELLANETLSQALGLAMRKGIETKGRIDRNVQTMLGLLNLPTRADLARLQTKLEVIQGSLVNLSLKVDRLLADREQAARRSARKRAAPDAESEE
jgi:hypothetical protein